MRQSLFLCIVDIVKDHDNSFMQKKDNIGRLGLSTLQKVTVVFRILANGASTDSTDEYGGIGESTAILCMKKFYWAIVEDECNDYGNVVDSNPTPIPNVDVVDGEIERFQ
ncbi:hypothetical protein HHK36_027091 [Tetracentron sinense]|uniref:Uncharacterized protein n=1 Tax=Tetracentron sinense TaxID=13715 RepID=A0A834YJV9_TETSI|nr:hypothetical protein HHK36_027091 [Tetracentron sinense]